MKAIRPKKCAHCKVSFQPDRPFQPACSVKCALALVKVAKIKQERKEDKVVRERLKTRADHLKEAQVQFNKYIRLRDGNKCISSNRIIRGQTQAGHFYTTAARPDLRFNEDNCHSQGVTDNQFKSGNIIQYRKHLIRKIGIERVEALEIVGRSDWSIDEIKAIRDKYKQKCKEET